MGSDIEKWRCVRREREREIVYCNTVKLHIYHLLSIHTVISINYYVHGIYSLVGHGIN